MDVIPYQQVGIFVLFPSFLTQVEDLRFFRKEGGCFLTAERHLKIALSLLQTNTALKQERQHTERNYCVTWRVSWRRASERRWVQLGQSNYKLHTF